MMNRHGLVAGATGTGKTVTLHMMAEQLSTAGVPAFLADIKGDLSGLAMAAPGSDKLKARTDTIGQTWAGKTFPVEFLALGGDGNGIPVRATITSFGPILLSRVMELNDTQESSLQLIFHFAGTKNLELIDLKDLRAVIQFLTSDEGKAELEELGGLSKATAGVILRELVNLDKPKLVFFLDEARLLFNGASKAFLSAITTTIRLIRSKGVGIFFVTQTPKDVPRKSWASWPTASNTACARSPRKTPRR